MFSLKSLSDQAYNKSMKNNDLMHKNIRLTRRQFLLTMSVLGTGTGLLCGGGLTVGSLLLANRSSPTATPIPTSIPPTEIPLIPKPPIIGRNDWGAFPPDLNSTNEHGYFSADNPEGWYLYPDDLQGSYQTLVIHHAGFYEQDALSTLKEIQRSHREDRGWGDVAYHFFVDKDGTLYEGRDMGARGAHVEGFNTGSLGVCLLGNFLYETPSAIQLQNSDTLNRWLKYRLGLTHLAGHSDFNDFTACPGIFLIAQLEDMAKRADLIYGTDGYQALVQEDSCPCCACQALGS